MFIVYFGNYSLPEWTKKVFVPGGDMDWMSHFSFKIPTITTQLARLKSGFLIRDILHRFTAKTKSELSPDRSLWIYSGHDTTVASILNSFGLFDVCIFIFQNGSVPTISNLGICSVYSCRTHRIQLPFYLNFISLRIATTFNCSIKTQPKNRFHH